WRHQRLGRVQEGPVSRRPRKRRKSRAVSPFRRLTIIAGSAAATIAVVAALVVAYVAWSYNGPGPEARTGEATTVLLRRGAGLAEIANALENAGVVRSASVFITAAQVTGMSRDLKAGEYRFQSGASLARVLKAIRDGDVVRHYVTIPEGLTSEMAA